MDQPVYLIAGAGIIIMIIALFLKKPTGSKAFDAQTMLVQKQLDRAEMEKTLQRFVQQVKSENEAVVANVRNTKAALHDDIDVLRERLYTLEEKLEEMSQQISLSRQQTTLADELHAQGGDPRTEDSLLLRERFRRAFELRQEGLHIDEIAKRLGAGRGEIELIFSLSAQGEMRFDT